MQEWIGKRPTAGQKSLKIKYESLLVKAQNTIFTSNDKVLKAIEAECDKKSGRELDGVIALTTKSVIFLSNKENMIYDYSQINDIDIRVDGKDQNEWQLTLKIGRSIRTFDDIKKNEDSQEFIEILEHMIINQSQEILTTVNYDFDYFLHADRLEDLSRRNVKITSFLMKRDDLGSIKNGERLLREKHQNSKLIVEGYYQDQQKKGNFIVVDTHVHLYQYDNKERKAKQINNWSYNYFNNSVIDYFAVKTVINTDEGKLTLSSSGKTFANILAGYNILLITKQRKWHQKIIGFRSGMWWKRAIASIVYLFTILLIVGITVSENTNDIKPVASVTDSKEEKEEARKQEEKRLAEEKEKKEEAHKLEEKRLAEEKKKEEARKLEEKRLVEEKKKEEARKLEEKRLAEEKEKKEEAAQLAKAQEQNNVYYKNCTEVREAGAAPIQKGEPGYAKHLDRDGDGIACDR